MNLFAATHDPYFWLFAPRLKQLALSLVAVCALIGRAPGETPPASSDSAVAPAAQAAKPTPAINEPRVPDNVREAAERVEYVGPDTYILLDRNGQPQPVPGMTYEDFVKLWKQAQQSEDVQKSPRYVIESTLFDSTLNDSHAAINLQAIIRVMTDEQVEVPLGLVGAVLQGDADIRILPDADTTPAGADEAPQQVQTPSFITQNPQQGGCVAHLAAHSGERVAVTLKIVVPVTRDGTQSSLRIGCPRAVSSKLVMTTPTPVADVTTNIGTVLAQAPTDDGGTRLEVAGVVGDVRLTWRSADKAATELATVLSAANAMHVYIDGRSVRSTVRMTVQSYGGGFDRFRVQLPPGAQLVAVPSQDAETSRPSYRVSVEQGGAAAETPPKTLPVQTILVEFPTKQLAPAVVELVTEQPIELSTGSALELGGFNVVGAVRQFGDVAVEVADDWQARWEVGAHVRQVDSSDLVAELQKPESAGSFQYDRQPWSLGVRIAARRTRVHVVPQYEELHCLADEARLTLRLNYQVFGRRAFEFRVRMDGWELVGDPLDAGGLIDKEMVHLTGDGTLILPLVKASTPRADVSLVMRRQLSRDESRITIPLPVPIAESLGTGELTVKASSELELQPDLEDSVGLAPLAVSEAPEDQPNNGVYRFRTLQPEARFVAERIAKPQQVSARIDCGIDLSEVEANVEQTLTYNVRYVPIESLVFEIPGDVLLGEDELEIALATASASNGEQAADHDIPLTVTHTPEDFETSTLGDASRFRVALPEPRLGRFTIEARYRVPRQAANGASAAWRVPLIQPVEPSSVEWAAHVRPARGLGATLDSKALDTAWKPVGAPTAPAQSSVREYVAEGAANVLPLIVSETEFESPSATTIDRIWMQTWFSGELRQDRAAIRFRSTGSQVTVELPPHAAATDVEVLIDGKPADLLSQSSGRIVVRLRRKPLDQLQSDDVEVVEHTLELRSREPIRQGLFTRHRITPPLLVGGTALTNVYWQIILPGDQHIVRSPAHVSAASQWQWLGNYLWRHPAIEQADLERWAGAVEQEAPTETQNQYVYVGLAPVASIEVVSAPRWLIVLAASSLALALCLIWQYVPAVRHRWILVLVACVLAGLAAAFPGPAFLLAQASVLGVVAALFAVLLKKLLTRPSPWPVITTTGSSLRQVPPRSESILIPPVAAVASTAPTVTLRTTDVER